MNELFALEISNPRTRAEIVVTTAMETDTRLFVSSVRSSRGRSRLAVRPANAPARMTTKTRRPIINGLGMFDTAFSGLISGRNPPLFFMIHTSAAVSGFADELTRIAYVEVSASGRLHQALRPR